MSFEEYGCNLEEKWCYLDSENLEEQTWSDLVDLEEGEREEEDGQDGQAAVLLLPGMFQHKSFSSVQKRFTPI